ncbi:MAG: hypothetical protein U0X74_08675 [Anaerolineales bacterium]
MHDKNFLKSLYKLKYFPLLAGIGVGCIHFIISYFLIESASCSSGLLDTFLWAPGFTLRELIRPLTIDYFYQVLVSSILYGIGGGLLASKNTVVKMLSIVVLTLLFLSICYTFILFLSSSCA